MSNKLLITNARLFNSPEGNDTVNILVADGIIANIGKVKESPDFKAVLDIEGKIITPGFIDVHIQGAGGADVLDGTKEALEAISKTCARFGTTSFLATTLFKPGKDNKHLKVARENVGLNLGGANLLGIHLEGPFIALNKKGMILPESICPPSLKTFNEIKNITKDSLKMMTIAPEIKGNLELIHNLTDSGVVASFGHSEALFQETKKGIEAGISHVTHLFNAMPSIHHRNPGPLLAIFENEKVSVQIIPDGVHLHPAILKFAFDLVGEGRCVSITDGMQAIGLADGKYVYNGIEYESKDGTARYHDGTLIGTTLGLNQLIIKLMKFTGCSLTSAIKTVTENPARVLGLEGRKGSIDVGKDADLVILDNDYSVFLTIVGGEVVFQKA